MAIAKPKPLIDPKASARAVAAEKKHVERVCFAIAVFACHRISGSHKSMRELVECFWLLFFDL